MNDSTPLIDNPTHQPASFFERYAALHIDTAIITSVLLLLYFIMRAIYRPDTPLQFETMHEHMFSVCYVFYICYYIGFNIFRWHATPGRRIMSIYVRNETGELPSFERTGARIHIAALAYAPVLYSYTILALSITGLYNPFDNPALQGVSPLFVYCALWVIGSALALFIHLLTYFAVHFLRLMHHQIPRHKCIQDLLCDTAVVKGRF